MGLFTLFQSIAVSVILTVGYRHLPVICYLSPHTHSCILTSQIPHTLLLLTLITHSPFHTPSLPPSLPPFPPLLPSFQVASLEGYLTKYKEGLKLAKEKILQLQAEKVSRGSSCLCIQFLKK